MDLRIEKICYTQNFFNKIYFFLLPYMVSNLKSEFIVTKIKNCKVFLLAKMVINNLYYKSMNFTLYLTFFFCC